MNSFSSLRVQGQNYTSKQQSPTAREAILNFLRLVALDTSIASDFSQVWHVREFQLGDNLISYSLDQETEDTSNVFYLVCTGRVRLLGFDATVGRFVSTGLLLPQQTFGADHLFCNQPLPYRAIAASAGFVAQVAISDLMLWLQRLSNLQDYIHQVALERQALIFFKTTTELRSHKSHTLRQFLPYLVQTKISAGSSLVEATPPNKGRFWLASGTIYSSTAEIQPPLVGESWGYPDVTLPDISAETDLLLYHLPIKHWDSAGAIAPELFPPRYEEEDRGQGNSGISKPPILLFPQSQSPEDKGKHRLQGEKLPPQLPQLPHPPISSSNNLPIKQSPHQAISPSPNLLIKQSPHQAISPSPNLPQNHQATRPSWLTAWLWRRIPFIQQQSSSDCGAACLAMISRYWGKRFSLNMLRSLARTDRMGASLAALANAGEKLGYDALPVRASLSKLELQTNPWIAHWQGIHYVVVWQVKGSRVLISDPAIGKRSLSRQEFEANWTEYALLLSPTERLKTVKSEKISLGGIGQAFWHHRNLLVQIIFASVLLQVFGLATPLFTQVVLDQVIPDKNEVTLNVFAVAFLVFGIWRVGLTAVRQYLLDYFSNRMDATLIGSFISHALRLPLQFFASRQVGDIITRVQENRKIQLFLTRQAFCATLDALFAVVYLGLMAYYNLQLTLLVLGLILPIVILTVWASPFLKTVSREIFKRSAEQNSSMVEMMTGVATVKTTAAERPVRWRWEERFTNMVKVRFRGQKLANNLQLVNSLINHLGNTAVLWYGATLVIRGEMSVGQFVAFNMLIGNAINPILALVRQWDEFQEVVISIERLNDVLSAEPEENTQKPLLVLPPIRGDVHFENVTFRFNQDERNTLQNISFKVKAGQTIGIVGYSGSGKSTLVNLLASLYHPNSGRILIDGHDIAHVSPQSLRSQLGVVPQDSFLFSGTLLENITLYSSEFTLEQAIAAAKLADAHAFINALPLGYNTNVGEGGMTLSGGQRQRIAIARALVRKPRILILDEATSSLDAESEHRFQQNLAQFSRVSVTTPNEARTTFIIAHRLFTVRHADCILILDRGVLVEQGTHDELMTINGFYNQLAQQQLHL